MMIFREATTKQDAETIRQIRNSGCHWMTRDPRAIGVDEQARWWAERDPATCKLWLGRIAATDVGYGMLRRSEGRWWVSLAVLPRYQGNGYGTELYRHLALSTDQDVWAEILADNTPSIKACLSAGYQLAYAADRMAVLVHTK